jgi:hypothetical protein
MQNEIIIFMVVRNILERKELFLEVLSQAKKISNNFLIIDHGSDDDSKEFIRSYLDENNIQGELVGERYVESMDEMK